MNFLDTLLNSPNRSAVQETNNEKLDRSLAFMLTPSLDLTDTPTVELGPPTDGDRILDELWVDALGAVFRCTVAGTPGTWLQVRPAVLNTADLPASAPTNYLVHIADGPWVFKYWDGDSWEIP